MSGYAAGEGMAGIPKNIRAAADALREVPDLMPKAIDAGFSSEVANAALSRVSKVALAVAHHSDDVASRVDAAKRTYDAIEEQNTDEMKKPKDYLESDVNKDLPERDKDQRELDDARERDTEHKNDPSPETAPPGETPEPSETTAPPPTGG